MRCYTAGGRVLAACYRRCSKRNAPTVTVPPIPPVSRGEVVQAAPCMSAGAGAILPLFFNLYRTDIPENRGRICRSRCGSTAVT
jgi:hypothetical protein